MYKFMNKWRNLYGKGKNADDSAAGPSLTVCAQLMTREAYTMLSL